MYIKDFFKKWKKQVLFFPMLMSVSNMFLCDTGLGSKFPMFYRNLSVLAAAIFTFSYFILWMKQVAKDFSLWSQDMKGYFAIVGKYADKFAEIFSKMKGGGDKKL